MCESGDWPALGRFLEQDEIRLGCGTTHYFRPRCKRCECLRARAHSAWGCFRDFVSGTCGAPPKCLHRVRDTRSLCLAPTASSIDSNPPRSSTGRAGQPQFRTEGPGAAEQPRQLLEAAADAVGDEIDHAMLEHQHQLAAAAASSRATRRYAPPRSAPTRKAAPRMRARSSIAGGTSSRFACSAVRFPR